MPTLKEIEEQLAKDAQDGARALYAGQAKVAHTAGLDGRYTVQPGDTYESIALAVYGDEAYGADIFDASASAGGVSSNRATELPGGTVLVLPVVEIAGQPSARASAAVASGQAARRPVGDRANTTGVPTGRVGGVGDARKPAPARNRSRSSSSRRKRPAAKRPAAKRPAPTPPATSTE